MDQLRDMFSQIVSYIPDVLKGILLALLTWLVASIVRSIVVKGGKKAKLPKLMMKSKVASDEEKANNIIASIGNLIFFLIILFMIPSILNALNVQSLSEPFTNMTNGFFNYIPNIIGAVIIIFIGHLLAKVAKEIVTSFSAGLGLDKFVQKFNVENVELSKILGSVVYAVIIIPAAIASLEALKISSISEPSVMMLSTILNMLPNIISAVLIIIIGSIIGRFLYNLLSGILASTGMDSWVKKDSLKEDEQGYFKLSNIISKIVKYVVILLFIVEALQVLNLDVLTNVGAIVIGYLPKVLGATLLMILGYLGANFVGGLLEKNTSSKFIVFMAKAIIYIFLVFMVVSQLGLATNILEMAFALSLGALALAFVIAFGFGGKDFAKEQLDKLSKKLDD